MKKCPVCKKRAKLYRVGRVIHLKTDECCWACYLWLGGLPPRRNQTPAMRTNHSPLPYVESSSQ